MGKTGYIAELSCFAIVNRGGSIFYYVWLARFKNLNTEVHGLLGIS